AYSNRFFEDKLSVNGTYSYNNYNIESLNNGINRYIMPDTQYVIENKSAKTDHSISHRISTRESLSFDSLKTLTFNGSLTFKQSVNSTENNSESKDILGSTITSTDSRNLT